MARKIQQKDQENRKMCQLADIDHDTALNWAERVEKDQVNTVPSTRRAGKSQLPVNTDVCSLPGVIFYSDKRRTEMMHGISEKLARGYTRKSTKVNVGQLITKTKDVRVDTENTVITGALHNFVGLPSPAQPALQTQNSMTMAIMKRRNTQVKKYNLLVDRFRCALDKPQNQGTTPTSVTRNDSQLKTM